MNYVAYIILVFSWIFVIFGMIAIFKLKNLYTRILSASTIDTVASLLILFGLIFVRFQFDSVVRLILLILFLLITSPISSHVNIRSAYLIGVPVDHKDGEYV
jgi:multicomponent Na+:H+ antiporter subunit G